MHLSNFENYFQEHILGRGLDYYHSKLITSLETDDGHHYVASVDGTEMYNVHVVISENEDVTEISCDCPYDYDQLCKHMAAVLFAIREQKGVPIPGEIKQDLPSLLQSLDKEELIRILLEIADERPDIEKRLLFTYSKSENELLSSDRLIKEYIRRASRKGYIEWNQVDYALEGAEMVLEKARTKADEGNYKTAVLLGITVLANAVEILEYADDSSGSIGMVISWSIETIDRAICEGMDEFPLHEKAELFETLIKEAINERYDDWCEWRIDLLRVCVHFCAAEELRSTLEDRLSRMLKAVSTDSWRSSYEIIELKKLQLKIIENFDEDEKAERFIEENIVHPYFREQAITKAMQKGEYRKAIQLALDGEREAANQWNGSVKKFKEYRYQAYKLLGDIDKQKRLALEFLQHDDFNYYAELKGLYSPDEWQVKLKNIIAWFQSQKNRSYTYLSIIKEENLTEHILEYCKAKASTITELYPYLEERYPDEVNNLFIEYIRKEAEAASNRKQYQSVASIIKQFRKASSLGQPTDIIDELKLKNKRRPAFIDELEKVSFAFARKR